MILASMSPAAVLMAVWAVSLLSVLSLVIWMTRDEDENVEPEPEIPEGVEPYPLVSGGCCWHFSENAPERMKKTFVPAKVWHELSGEILWQDDTGGSKRYSSKEAAIQNLKRAMKAAQ